MICQDFYLNEAERIQNNFLNFFFQRVEMLNLSYILEALRHNTMPVPSCSKDGQRYPPDKYWGNQLCYLVESDFFQWIALSAFQNWRQGFYLDEPETVMNSPVLRTVTKNVTKQKSKALEMYFRKAEHKKLLSRFLLLATPKWFICRKTKRNVNVCDSLPYPTEFLTSNSNKKNGGRAQADVTTKISDIDKSSFSFFAWDSAARA